MKARVAEIHPNPYNSRIYYDEESLKQLANSITKYGLDNPITVRKVEGGSYQIAAGHRRFEAVKSLGWDEVDVTVRDLTDDDMLDLTIAENLQREDLTKVEIARSLQHYVKRGMTQQEIAVKIDKSQGYVAQALATAELPDEVQEAIITRVISDTHGRELLWFQKFYERSHVTKEEWKLNYTSGYSRKEHIKRIINMMLFLCKQDEMSSRDLHDCLEEWKANIIWHRFNLGDPSKIELRKETRNKIGLHYDEKLDDSIEMCSKLALREWNIDYSKVGLSKDGRLLLDQDLEDFAWLCRHDKIGEKIEEEMKEWGMNEASHSPSH